MCIVIAKPAGTKIPENFLRESYRSNPHGVGFSYAYAGTVRTVKGNLTLKEFLAAYNQLITPTTPAIVHFRWATAGEQSVRNCHPFSVVEGKSAMAHNGTLASPYGRFRDGRSDTAEFCSRVLTPLMGKLQQNLDGNFLVNDPAFIEMLSLAIGDGNKMVFIDSFGSIGIANQHLGHWLNGVWYSNYDYVPTPKKVKSKK